MTLTKLFTAATVLVAGMAAPAFAQADTAAPAPAPPVGTPWSAPNAAPVIDPTSGAVSANAAAATESVMATPASLVATSSPAAAAAKNPLLEGLGNFAKAWPPQLPPLIGVEVVMGPRFGESASKFPSFPRTTQGGDPNITKTPEIFNQTNSSAGNFGAQAELQFKIPFLGPAVGVEFEGAGVPVEGVASNSVFVNTAVASILPTTQLGIYGKLLGIKLGLRSESFASLPGLTGPQSANEVVGGYGMAIGLGPVEADAHGEAGFGPVSGQTGAIVISPSGEASLALKLIGIKVAVGVRAQASGYGSDPSKAFSLLTSLWAPPTNLDSAIDKTKNGPAAVEKALLGVGQLSYQWGPFVQAGISF